MDDAQAFHHDPVERFFEIRFPATVDGELRRTLLARTTRLLHRRRRWLRSGYAAAFLGSYVLGLGTLYLGMRSPQPRSETTAAAQDAAPASGLAQAPPPVERDPEVPAFVLERMAQSGEENRAHLYRLAGDRYLADGDFRSAVHCYGRFLDTGSEADWILSKDDNWLLTHLKTARQEEKWYAKSAG